jgi:succinate dehydrogenase / fumarate reductase cytochrome b subunit
MPERSPAGRAAERPLSPHLQIYSPLINMVMSILHRISGAALYFGTLLLAAWLVAAASGPQAFDTVTGLFSTLPGQLVLLGYTWALIHHGLGGVRHLIWDTGRGLGLGTVNLLSWLTIVGSLLLTALVWAIGLKLGGRL